MTLPADTSEADIIAEVKKLNEDKTIHGILVRMQQHKLCCVVLCRAALHVHCFIVRASSCVLRCACCGALAVFEILCQ